MNLQEVAQALQPLAIGQVQVEQHRVDIALVAVEFDPVLQRPGLDPFDRHAGNIAVQGPDAEPDEFMIVDQKNLAPSQRNPRNAGRHPGDR